VLGDRYRVISRIGSGGMAEVFRAHDRVLDRPVAIKVFRSEHVSRDDAHGVERQQLEVAALARLNHPNLITLYDGSIGAVAGPAYIVMELIEGPSLGSRIAEGPLPEPAVREIGIQLADGLAYVHAQGMVHRDVKPENILLGVDRSDDDSTVRARLSDFGIVRLLGSERLTNVNFTLGTASYLAPEQARGSDVNPPADVYALGLVLLEALTGAKSFDGPPIETAMARLSQRPHIPDDLPAPWPALLYAMTEFDPALRPPAAEVARALRTEGSRSLPVAAAAIPAAAGFASAPTGLIGAAAAEPFTGGPVAPPPAGPPPGATGPGSPVPGKRRRRPPAVVIAAAVSLLAIAGAVSAFLLTGNDPKAPAQTPSVHVTSPAADRTSTGHHVAPARHSTAPGGRRSAPPSTSAHTSSAPSSSAPRSSSGPTSSAPRSSSPPSRSAHTSPARTTPPSSPAGSSQPASSQSVSSPAGSSQPPSPNSATTTGAGG
jgi:eukaryotic-like serine/threonine-protein kinase